MTSEELTKISESLKKSPLFNLSLASKELFHSNFLAWLIENNSSAFLKEFPAYLHDELEIKDFDSAEVYDSVAKHSEEFGVDRERQNFDLSFYLKNFNSKRFVIIENKLKSLPREQQLTDYSEKVKKEGNVNFTGILLSLIKPKFILPDNWTWWSYDQYLSFLGRFINSNKTSYHSHLINDYVHFTDNLRQLIPTELEDNHFNFHSDRRLDVLRDLRIYDIFLKSQYYLLGEEIHEALQEILNDEVDLAPFGLPIEIKHFEDFKKPRIFINSGFSRGQGQIDIKFLIKEGLALTVQIEGESYRKMIQDSVMKESEYTRKRIAKSARDNANFWFQFNHIDPEPRIYPKFPNKKQ